MALVVLVVVSVSQFANTPQAAPPAFTAVPERPPLGNISEPSGFVRSGGQTQYLDLDTEEGHFSLWRQTDIGRSTALHATFQVLRLGADPVWHPAFFIGLQGQTVGAWYQRWVGVRVAPARGDSSPLTVEIDRVDNPRISERHVLKAHLDVSEQAGVTIDWHTPHVVTITLSDGETQQIEVPWTIENVVAAASTGEMEVNPIALGTLKR